MPKIGGSRSRCRERDHAATGRPRHIAGLGTSLKNGSSACATWGRCSQTTSLAPVWGGPLQRAGKLLLGLKLNCLNVPNRGRDLVGNLPGG